MVNIFLWGDYGLSEKVEIVVALSGFHGTGKTTIAKKLATRYGLKYVSSGMIFRNLAKVMNLSLEELSKLAETKPDIDYAIDDRLKKIASEGGVVADALLSGWMLKDVAHIKMWFHAPLEVRIKRIADREKRDYKEVYKETLAREYSEVSRFKRYYNIDLNDLSTYDFVISTYPYSLDAVVSIVYSIVDGYLESVHHE